MRCMAFALRSVILVAAVPLLAAASPLPLSEHAIDSTAERVMRTFNIPGLAIGIVKDGKLVYAKGFGVRASGAVARVDADTQFQIGSNTKAFTTAALAMLMDQGKLRWDDKVSDYLPDFQLYDPNVTREFTIRDLLTHRSGLGLGAGDLMFLPDTDFSRSEVIHNLRYLKPVTSFRSQFAYDNLLYIAAGQIVERVSGQSWESFVEERIMKPLKMKGCAAAYDRLTARDNFASPHAEVEGKLTRIPVQSLKVVGPAGTINCSINGMAEWLKTQLAAGRKPQGGDLFSAARSDEMWSMTTPQILNETLASLTRTHFRGYGLGWEMEDEFGYKLLWHTGGVPGTVTWVGMIPELKLGLLVFTNQQDVFGMEALAHQILDAYEGAPKRDWPALAASYKESQAAAGVKATAGERAAPREPPPLPLAAYAGLYHDAWRGDATVALEGDHLVLTVSRTKELQGRLESFSGNVFIVRWNNRSLDADAYVRFSQGFGASVEGMTMKAVSPDTDFSFDFQDLDFRKSDPQAQKGTP